MDCMLRKINTGNFYMDQSDATMNELNGEFSITRSYNSKGTDQHSMFGRGWSFNYDQSLSQMEDGSLLYMRGDGSYLIFDKNEDGSYTTPDGYVYVSRNRIQNWGTTGSKICQRY